MADRLDQLAGIVVGDVEAAQTELTAALDRLTGLATGLVALMESLGGETR